MEKIAELTGCRTEVVPGAPTAKFARIDVGRIRSEFGFRPQNLLDRMSDLVEAYRAQYKRQHDSD
jgi:hypothetical protein